ncbi:MAG: prolipoprotein diacylglyceryl transferase, partial [Ktedonobacteraceae bacterium]|nr:prolipoprotein diacylglyceryl transferase [Ktedonobacteraceae bacterium]
LHLGAYAISTYSLLFLCAYVVGGIVTYYEARRQHRATEAILRVALGALGGGLIGAKLSMFLFLGPTTFIKDLPYLWYSGQSWTGGFFGGYLAVLLVKRFNHIHYSTGDIFAPALPLAQAIGRLGNVLGGDPFGLPSTVPWAIMQQGVFRQPSALYEMLLDLLLFVIIWRLRDKMPQPGDLFKLYVVGYCSFRFLVDFSRADPHVLLGLTLVQVLYLPAIIWFSYRLRISWCESQQLKAAPADKATKIV